MGPKFEQNSVVEVEKDDGREGMNPKSSNAGRNAKSKITNLINNLEARLGQHETFRYGSVILKISQIVDRHNILFVQNSSFKNSGVKKKRAY